MYDFQNDGLFHLARACSETDLWQIERQFLSISADVAGVRLAGLPELDKLLGANGVIGEIASRLMRQPAKPVRAVMFDKSHGNNWGLAWHQDRTIVVKERIDVTGFGPWTVKSGLTHVAPPVKILAAMITLRIHLDPVPDDNAPLLVLPGSHKLGRISEDEIKSLAQLRPTTTYLAERGDIWAYATLIVHASKPSNVLTGRRVLQVDYSKDDLSGGLEWLGVS